MSASSQEQYGQIANYNISPKTRADGQSGALEVDQYGNTKITINSNAGVLSASPLNGQTKMTGSAVQLPSNTLLNGVIVTALSTNSATIEIGGSGVTNVVDGTGNGYILAPGASMSWAVANTNALYAIGTSNDVLSFAGS